MRSQSFFIVIVLILAVVFGTTQAQQERELREKQRQKMHREQLRQERIPPARMAQVRISEEEEKALIEYYSMVDANVAEEMARLKERNLQRYEKRLQHMYRERLYLERIQEENPERFAEALELRKLAAESRELARQYRKSKDENEQKKLELQLNDILNRLFDLRENERAIEMERVKERLARMQHEMQERKENKAKIIKDRLNELMGKEYLHEW